eukprot:UN01157
MTPLQQLFYHCKRADIPGIKLISNRVTDINAADEVGTKNNSYISRNTALHYAVLSGSLDCVKVIYNLEAKLDSRNKIKSTPLHIAASLGYTEIVKFLLEMAADIEAINIIQNTPLHCAVYAGHVETVQAILDKCDNKRDALMSPVNLVQFGAVKYTAHDEMKIYLKQFFPKRRNNMQIEEEEDEKIHESPPKYDNIEQNQNEIQEEVDETTPLNIETEQ